MTATSTTPASNAATELELFSFLYFTGNGSDKVYHVHLRVAQDAPGLWEVSYANGPRGGTLRTGMKSTSPLEWTDAKALYDKTVKSKTSSGYTPDQDGTLYTASEVAGRASGHLPQLPTAITAEEAEQYLANTSWGLQRKEDGENRMLVIEGGAMRGTNRRGLFVDIPVHWVCPSLEGQTVIAGEHVGDRFKAFDLLHLNGRDLRPQPFVDRFEQLEQISRSMPWLEVIPLETTVHAKFNRVREILESDGEGYVLKRLDAPFSEGRSDTSLKFKFTESATCIALKRNTQRSIAVGLRDDAGNMIDMGNVTIPPGAALPEPGALVEVRYLYRYDGGKFEQPVFQGVRTDLLESDATLAQITRIKVRGERTSDRPEEDENDAAPAPRA